MRRWPMRSSSTYIEVKIERRRHDSSLTSFAPRVDVREPLSKQCRNASKDRAKPLFATASDAQFANLSTVDVVMLNVYAAAPSAMLFERDMPELLIDGGLRTQLITDVLHFIWILRSFRRQA